MSARAPHSEFESRCRLTADAVVLAARPDGSVDLEFAPFPGCDGCAGTCLWKRLRSSRLDRLPVAGSLEPGARVTVALSAQRVMMASILVHGVPLAAILSGAAAGSFVAGSDLGALAGAAVALAVAIPGVSLLRRRVEAATLAALVVRPKP